MLDFATHLLPQAASLVDNQYAGASTGAALQGAQTGVGLRVLSTHAGIERSEIVESGKRALSNSAPKGAIIAAQTRDSAPLPAAAGCAWTPPANPRSHLRRAGDVLEWHAPEHGQARHADGKRIAANEPVVVSGG